MASSTVPRAPRGTRPCLDPDQQRFRDAMAELPAGVTVLTTMAAAGPVGMTTSAVASLSLAPRLVLVCVANGSGTLAEILRHRAFAVNVLADTMAELSTAFAQGPLLERFAGVAHHVREGVPVLDGAVATIVCRVHETHPGGDHTILVGDVRHARHTGGRPLLRHRGAYRGLF
ncbi:flavin reductase family protein [Streptomyces palmae]|uniref:Flavin reductase n=1 Tax=Streptomyces palmae TaxID=1701085 RepID=A0A4Z0HDN2_9ACTN|nr:flavin reductase family protein [Streptomyces palmae]TGB18951.1 flavin reductase [Streptomyces palmae]